jgi:hypothetical protein
MRTVSSKNAVRLAGRHSTTPGSRITKAPATMRPTVRYRGTLRILGIYDLRGGMDYYIDIIPNTINNHRVHLVWFIRTREGLLGRAAADRPQRGRLAISRGSAGPKWRIPWPVVAPLRSDVVGAARVETV